MFIDFSFLVSKEVLIYDQVSLPILKHIFKNKDYNVYYNRMERVNFWILIFTLFKFKFSNFKELKKQYKINYIYSCSPKIIITFIDNNPAFFELKSIYPKEKTFFIQNGIRKKNDLKIFKKNKKYFCDYFFVFSRYYKKFFSKSIKSKYIESGSIKMNEYKKRTFDRKKEILFISQTPSNSLKLEKIEKFLIENLISICTTTKLVLNILCKKNVKQILIKEFKQIEPENITESDAQFLPYKLIQKYELKIFVDSTLGLESLAIGEKALAIPIGCKNKHLARFKTKRKVEKFGYPSHLADQGYCWNNDFKYSVIKMKILKLINLKRLAWNKIHKKERFMNYDAGNKKLRNILKEKKISL